MEALYYRRNYGGDILNELKNYLTMLKVHDYDTYLHSRRVASLAILLGEKVGLVEKEIDQLMVAALLHDIGKVNIPKRILKKPGILNANERMEILNHPNYGVQIIKGSDCFSKEIINGIESHHEYFNGNGYSNGLKGEDIPIFARIIAVADAFDAMTNFRPYRSKPLSYSEALSEIQIHSGSQFDPYLVKNIKKISLNYAVY